MPMSEVGLLNGSGLYRGCVTIFYGWVESHGPYVEVGVRLDLDFTTKLI